MVAPTNYTVGLDSARVARALELAPDVLIEELIPAVIEAQLLAEREIRERTPTSGAGTLRDSIGALPVKFSETAVIGEVGTALAYAQPVETGSKAHFPPVEPIADWVRRKLGIKDEAQAKSIAFAIARKISIEGSEGAFMFRDGLAFAQAQILEILGAGVDRALARAEQ
ncbi:HK97 gp10 family phage protein [Methylopila sp. M107]|uniref:HK97 gp10 family phage protein n=1 Tax=Methylopila sp. M107 TaxID=1101190 RepID=UPI00036AD689|nr:HK97 gp10 family phage protein [Methylopila sp. M107]